MTDNTHYVTDGKLSIKLGSTSTTQEHALGSRATGNNGTVWRYVKATFAVSQYDTVTFPQTWLIQPATPTTVATGGNIGFAQVAFAAGEYGWVCTEADKLTVAVSATTTAAIQLYIATTSGKLSTTSSSGTLGGVFVDATTSASTGVTLTTAIARAPHYKVL
jgi:hypothetical protein